MRVAIFSDVHGNLTALRAVLEDIATQEGVHTVIFAGDLCVYGPRPEACVDLLRSYDDEIASLYGNTDQWIDGPPILSDDLDEAERRRWQQVDDIVSWTRERLPPMDRAWLSALPFHRRISPSVNPRDDLFVVHANPYDVDQIIFPPEARQKELYGDLRQSDRDLELFLDDLVTDVLAFGHLHVPFVRHWGDVTLVNVSAVSMPGDGDARAGYALFDWNGESWDVTHRRIAYDVDEEIAAFRETQPPGWEEAVERLEREGMIAQEV
ncbi:MAG: metallophosphoesterase family protein [Candidatus Promineifilaceae bacterium]|nr:metallophosphoesterase family protein [Candidatus Promineifilaceae bacterium]